MRDEPNINTDIYYLEDETDHLLTFMLGHYPASFLFNLIKAYLSALVFFLCTIYNILPALYNLVFVILLTLISWDRIDASCIYTKTIYFYSKICWTCCYVVRNRRTVKAAIVCKGGCCPKSGDSPLVAPASVSSLHVVSKSAGGTPNNA